MDLKELDLVDPHSHWYYQSKLEGVRRLLRNSTASAPSIVDIGAGSGFFSLALAADHSQARVMCVDPNYSATDLATTGQVQFVRSADSQELARADVMLFIDVLEHVDDARGLLAEYVDHASAGCRVVISVPAFMSLWSPHDDFLEHRYRYTLREIESVVKAAGLRIIEGRYLFASIVVPVWIIRRLKRSAGPRSDLKPAPPALNALLRSVLKLEHRFLRTRLAGLSALVLAEVQEEAGGQADSE